MKRTINLLLVVIIINSIPLLSNAQSSFFSHREYHDIPLSLGFSHVVAHAEGCNRGWALWVGLGNVELGYGFDFKDYSSKTIEDWSTTHYGESYTRYTTDVVMSGTSYSQYIGYFLNNYLSVGCFLDFRYGRHKLHTKIEHYGYGISSDYTFWEDDYQNPFSIGIYAKGSYRIKDYFDIFALVQLAPNWDSGLSLGVAVCF